MHTPNKSVEREWKAMNNSHAEAWGGNIFHWPEPMQAMWELGRFCLKGRQGLFQPRQFVVWVFLDKVIILWPYIIPYDYITVRMSTALSEHEQFDSLIWDFCSWVVFRFQSSMAKFLCWPQTAGEVWAWISFDGWTLVGEGIVHPAVSNCFQFVSHVIYLICLIQVPQANTWRWIQSTWEQLEEWHLGASTEMGLEPCKGVTRLRLNVLTLPRVTAGGCLLLVS